MFADGQDNRRTLASEACLSIRTAHRIRQYRTRTDLRNARLLLLEWNLRTVACLMSLGRAAQFFSLSAPRKLAFLNALVLR
jgi:hypothetical protein